MQLKFIVIPDKILDAKGIRPIDRVLYGIIFSLCQLEKGKCTASNATLARLARSTSSTIQAGLLRLEKINAIRRILTITDGKTTRLEIVPLIDWAHLQIEVGTPSGEGMGIPSNVGGGTPSNVAQSNTLNTSSNTEASGKPLAKPVQSKEKPIESPWVFSEKMALMKDSPQQGMRILFAYWTFKKFVASNKKQYEFELRRQLKVINRLAKSGYDIQDIIGTMRWCDGESDGGTKWTWTLETVEKRIAEHVTAKRRQHA